MVGRLGTRADAVFSESAVAAILAGTDSVIEDDVRVGMFLKGAVSEDANGRFYYVDGIVPTEEGAVGMCLTSETEGTEATAEDVGRFLTSFKSGILMVVDPYSCEFSFYKVDGDGCVPAVVMMSE